MTNDLNLSSADLWLAASNVLHWSSYYAIQNTFKYGELALVVAAPLYIVGGTIYSLAIYEMIPKNASFFRKITTFPFPTSYPFEDFDFYKLGLLSKIKQVFNLYTMTQNTLPKLSNCAKNLTTHPIRALVYGSIHAFNLGSEIFHVANSFGLFTKGRNSFQSENKPKQNLSDSTKPQTNHEQIPNFEMMDDISRLTNPKLDPERFSDAKKMLQFPDQKIHPQTCFKNGNSYIRETCDNICSAIKKISRNIFLKVHPDKNSQPLARIACQNLSIAKETLLSAYNC